MSRRAPRTLAAAATLSAIVLSACTPAEPASSTPSPAASGSASGGAATTPSPTPETGLVWSDEFDDDLDRWDSEIGAGGWGNDELQAYTDRPENVFVRDGMLNIVAREEQFVDPAGIGVSYTSARLVSKAAFLHGRFEARINAPVGSGLWSAFWLLGISDQPVWWPEVGEIDIMELVNDTTTLHATVWGDTVRGDAWKHNATLDTGQPWGGEWHVYAAEWSPDEVVFRVDGTEVARISPDDLVSGENWALTTPANIILNIALGGYAGPPNVDTPFPAAMKVDWVRVYDADLYDRRGVTPRVD